MKFLLTITLAFLSAPSAYATTAPGNSAPEACQSYKDGDIQGALSCVMALDRLWSDGEGIKTLIFVGTTIPATIGGAVVSDIVLGGPQGMNAAGIRGLSARLAVGSAVGMAIGIAVSAGIIWMTSSSGTSGTDTVVGALSADDLQVFLNMKPSDQQLVLSWRPANLETTLMQIAAKARDAK